MKKICIVTTSRAEYGLLRNLIRKVYEDEELELCLMVTGTHLSKECGYTIEEIDADNFPIAKKIAILSENREEKGVAETMATALVKFEEAFEKCRPDMLVVLGDRYELISICWAAFLLKIPIAHISGGELTEGAIDDVVRHSLTKMSRLHFPACEVYRKRIIQLGENPDTVFNYGDIGVENIINMEYMDKLELEHSLGIRLDLPYSCVTFHPVTLSHESMEHQTGELLKALEHFPHMEFIITGSNIDAGGEKINQMISEFVKCHHHCFMYESLGIKRYLSLMKNCEMVIGNSSSGIVEAPCFGIPTVNIGDRQKGRLRAESIIDCRPVCEEIIQAMETAMTEDFKEKAKNAKNPYGLGNTSEGIIKEIKAYLSEPRNAEKKFYDIPFYALPKRADI